MVCFADLSVKGSGRERVNDGRREGVKEGEGREGEGGKRRER